MQLRPYQVDAIKEAFDTLKINDDPVLLECSVGGGKSFMLASIAKRFDDIGKRVLCLVSSAELVRNNSQAYTELNGKPSVFCASLSDKSYKQNIVFATPQSVASALKKNHPIGNIRFNLIIVDEAHGINYHAKKSTFITILRHYKQEYKDMRVLGLTGTAFRGSTSIVGEHAFFKTKVGNISTQYLIENGFLVHPKFGHHEIEGFDFSKCKIQNTGEFKYDDLKKVIETKKRLTWEILQEAQLIMNKRNCIMIFCSTVAHCYEALEALPKESARIVLGSTPDEERNESLNLARKGKVKWLISVNCLLTGVNITLLDGLIWLRPTSSLLLFIQGLGRGLRLHSEKEDCLVLDYAGNLDRFQDFDNPIINDAIQPKTENEKEYVIICPVCNVLNSEHARRCRNIKVVDEETSKESRCKYYFEFKECSNDECVAQNDIAARLCHACGGELIDPNAKLSMVRVQSKIYHVDVLEASYGISGTQRGFRVNCAYKCRDESGRIGSVFEHYSPVSERAAIVFYGQFVKKHCANASQYYMYLNDRSKVEEMLHSADVPVSLLISKEDNGTKIKKKIFN